MGVPSLEDQWRAAELYCPDLLKKLKDLEKPEEPRSRSEDPDGILIIREEIALEALQDFARLFLEE